jgi:tRNA (adenine57-N1/adenine58-N1)-methyltransferase catalytic subunit
MALAPTFAGVGRGFTPAMGETVIIYEGGQAFTPAKLVPGGSFQNRFGIFKHEDFVGHRYGSKVRAAAGDGGGTRGYVDEPSRVAAGGTAPRSRGAVMLTAARIASCPLASRDAQVFSRGKRVGYVYLLAFSPELWTHALTHRTQILFAVDIAMVVMHLSLRPGSRVVESGTGSGSLTTSLARAVAPGGHVFSFEFNADRAAKAREDFTANGMDAVVTVAHRDVCGPAGFCEPGSPLEGTVDGVFLDLPQPWLALGHAARVLRPCGVLCSFSPCVEQVQRAAEEMRAAGFEDVRTIEALLRPYDVGNADALGAPPALLAGVFGDVSGEGSGGGNRRGAGGSGPAHKRPRPDAAQPSAAPAVAAAAAAAEAAPAPAAAATAASSSPSAAAAAVAESPSALPGAAQEGQQAGSDAANGSSSAAAGAGAGAAADTMQVDADAAASPPAATSSAAAPAADAASSTSAPAAPAPAAPLIPRMAAFPAPASARQLQRGAVTPATTIRGHTGFLTFATLYRKKQQPAAAAAAGAAAASASSDAAAAI